MDLPRLDHLRLPLQGPGAARRDGTSARTRQAGWTELFFLDEVTALAAGHRPCFTCRRAEATDFLQRYGQAFDEPAPRVPSLDRKLHVERLASGGSAVSIKQDVLGNLPNGAMIQDGNRCHAILEGHALPWTFAGYREPVALDALVGTVFELITPPTTIAVLRAGYRPVWHETASL